MPACPNCSDWQPRSASVCSRCGTAIPATQATSTAQAILATKREAEAEAAAAYRRSLRGRIEAITEALWNIATYAGPPFAPPIAAAFALVMAGEAWQVAVLAAVAGAIFGGGVFLLIVFLDIAGAFDDATAATHLLLMLLPGIVAVPVALLISAAL